MSVDINKTSFRDVNFGDILEKISAINLDGQTDIMKNKLEEYIASISQTIKISKRPISELVNHGLQMALKPKASIFLKLGGQKGYSEYVNEAEKIANKVISFISEEIDVELDKVSFDNRKDMSINR